MVLLCMFHILFILPSIILGGLLLGSSSASLKMALFKALTRTQTQANTHPRHPSIGAQARAHIHKQSPPPFLSFLSISPSLFLSPLSFVCVCLSLSSPVYPSPPSLFLFSLPLSLSPSLLLSLIKIIIDKVAGWWWLENAIIVFIISFTVKTLAIRCGRIY